MAKQSQFACAQWPWGTKSKEEFIVSCKEMAEVGFHHFESVKAFIDTFIDMPQEFKAITEEYDVKPISFYFHFKGNPEIDLGELNSKIAFVGANEGIKTISIQAPKRSEKVTEEDLQYFINTINEYARICKPYGITPCIHPHHNTTVQFRDEIDYVLKNTDPDLIGFGPDTAHLITGNCLPEDVFEAYKDRIQFVHLKDITGTNAGSEGIKGEIGVEVYNNFREMGEGIVNFPKVFDILKSVNFRGYLTAELDKTRFSNKKSAEMNLEYLKKNW